MIFSELKLLILQDLIAKSGVREWEDPEARTALVAAAREMAEALFEGDEMALPDFMKVTTGTVKTIKATGGDAAITLASLANGNGTSAGARQAVTLDLTEFWARWWRIDTDFELAATPTAGNAIYLHGSCSNATGAGRGNTSGTDADYTGYSNNIDSALNHLDLLAIHRCTSQATTTVQKCQSGLFFPTGRYLNLVVNNKSGAAFHSTDTNQVITLTPLEELIQDAV